MIRADDGARAWDGDPERKRQALQAVATAIDTQPQAVALPLLRPTGPWDPNDKKVPSNIYWVAFGTAEQDELAARSGVTLGVLEVISAVLSACNCPEPAGDGPRAWHVAPAAVGGAVKALDAIPVGAELAGVPQRYMRAVFDDLQSGALLDGRALSSDGQQALSQVAALHRAGSSDAAAFRAARRVAVQATDSATSDLDRVVLKFVESVAWPADGLGGELAGHVLTLHFGLLELLSSRQPTAEERRVHAVVMSTYESLAEEQRADPTLDWEWRRKRALQVPEVVVAESKEFRARMAECALVACDEHAPRAVAGLMRALAARGRSSTGA
ncbi:MAG: hypothetical protein U1F08_03265 [Steroidobacteraceae bacterium]